MFLICAYIFWYDFKTIRALLKTHTHCSMLIAKYLVGFNKNNTRMVNLNITGHSHFKNHLATVGLFKGDNISSRLRWQALESANPILFKWEPLEISRRRILEVWKNRCKCDEVVNFTWPDYIWSVKIIIYNKIYDS